MEKQKNKFLDWLEKLQQESWQLELLISGFLLSLLVGANEYVSELLNASIRLTSDGVGTIFYFLLLFVYISCNILIINLVVHVLLRSLWIGAIGLRNISGDINFDNLQFSPKFDQYLRRKLPTFDVFIERLENFCCLVFAYTFLIVFSILSFFVAFLILIGSFWLITEIALMVFPKIVRRIVLTPIFTALLLFGILYIIDFLSLGRIKRIKWLSKVYLPFYRFYSIISFSTVYRPLYYNMIDNPLGKKVMLSILPYLTAFGLYSIISYNDSKFYPLFPSYLTLQNMNYEEKQGKENEYPSISLDKQVYDDDDFMQLFFPLFGYEKRFSRKKCAGSTLNEVGIGWQGSLRQGFDEGYKMKEKINVDSIDKVHLNEAKASLQCITADIDIFLNDSLVKNVDYSFYKHTKYNLKGILATLDLEKLKRGKHIVKFQIRDSTNRVVIVHSVPFWRK